MKKATRTALLVLLGLGLGLMAYRSLGPKRVYAEKKTQKLAILMYHSVDSEFKESKIRISPERFEADLKYIRDKGYNVIDFQQLIDHREKGTRLPDKPVIISFDDGQLNNYSQAYPILKKYGMKATIFLITSRQGVRNYKGDKLLSYFDWNQAREMERSGLISIMPHSHELHNYRKTEETGKGVERALNESDKDYISRLDRDLKKSQEVFREKLGKEVNVYAYPFGIYSKESEELLKKYGYKVSLTTRSDMADIGEDLFLLKRYNMGFDRPIESVLK